MPENDKAIQLLEEARDLLLTAPVGHHSTIFEYFAWADKCRVWRKELSNVLLSRIRDPKHDGKLGRYSIDYDTRRNDSGYVLIEAIDNPHGEDEINISPKEALSLFSWLTQERSTLEELAKGHLDE